MPRAAGGRATLTKPPRGVPVAADASPADHDAALRDLGRSGQVINPAAAQGRHRDTGPSR